jgi:RNA polymerase sigma-70 factor (ECF subfamily)
LAEERRLSTQHGAQPVPPADSDTGAAALPAAPDEASLARRFATGQPAAFEEVVAAYAGRVERLAHRLLSWRAAEVDDAVQDVFLAALTHGRRLRGDAGLWPWLASITVNACRTHRRRVWVREKFFASQRQSAREAAAADASAASRETLDEIRRAIDRLRGADREVIVLHGLEEMPLADVAHVLGISLNAAHVRLHRARGRLQRELKMDESK